MTQAEAQAELDAIMRRVQVKVFFGVLQRPEDSYEWARACQLEDVLKAGD